MSRRAVAERRDRAPRQHQDADRLVLAHHGDAEERAKAARLRLLDIGVLRIGKDVGDRVGPGELLLELDSTEYQLAVQQARPVLKAGKRLYIGSDRDPLQIVGIVGHVKQWSLDNADDAESLQAQLYEPFRQIGGTLGAGVVMRGDDSAGRPNFDSIRQLVQSQNSENVVFEPQSLSEVISASLSSHRFSMILLNSFAIVALLLASIGLYGVISYLVGQRTREFGIRLALGAQRRAVVGLVLTQGMKMTLCGVGLGLVAAFGLTRLMSQMVFGVSTTDPLTFVALTVGLSFVALLACFLPARRATKVDPLKALRYE